MTGEVQVGGEKLAWVRAAWPKERGGPFSTVTRERSTAGPPRVSTGSASADSAKREDGNLSPWREPGGCGGHLHAPFWSLPENRGHPWALVSRNQPPHVLRDGCNFYNRCVFKGLVKSQRLFKSRFAFIKQLLLRTRQWSDSE